jgi:hypothetical protein
VAEGMQSKPLAPCPSMSRRLNALSMTCQSSKSLASEFDLPIHYSNPIIKIPAPPAPRANSFDLRLPAAAAPVSVCKGGREVVAVECVVVAVVEWNGVICVEEEG